MLLRQLTGLDPQLLQYCLTDTGHIKRKERPMRSDTSTFRRFKMDTITVLCDQGKGILLADP